MDFRIYSFIIFYSLLNVAAGPSNAQTNNGEEKWRDGIYKQDKRNRELNLKEASLMKQQNVTAIIVEGFELNYSDSTKRGYHELTLLDNEGFKKFSARCSYPDSSDKVYYFHYDDWRNLQRYIIQDMRNGSIDTTESNFDSTGFRVSQYHLRSYDSTYRIYGNRNLELEYGHYQKYGNHIEKNIYEGNRMIKNVVTNFQKPEVNRPWSSTGHGMTPLYNDKNRFLSDTTYCNWDGKEETTTLFTYNSRNGITSKICYVKFKKTYVTVSYDFDNESNHIYNSDTIKISVDTVKIIQRVKYSYDWRGRIILEIDSSENELKKLIYNYKRKYQELNAFRTRNRNEALKHEYFSRFDRNGNQVFCTTTDGSKNGEKYYSKYDEYGNQVEFVDNIVIMDSVGNFHEQPFSRESTLYYDGGLQMKRKERYCYDYKPIKTRTGEEIYPACMPWKSVYEFNEEGNYTLYEEYETKDSLKRRTIYTYDHFGNELEVNTWGYEGKLTWKTEKNYDANGLLLLERSINSQGEEVRKMEYKYFKSE